MSSLARSENKTMSRLVICFFLYIGLRFFSRVGGNSSLQFFNLRFYQGRLVSNLALLHMMVLSTL